MDAYTVAAKCPIARDTSFGRCSLQLGKNNKDTLLSIKLDVQLEHTFGPYLKSSLPFLEMDQ